MCEGEGKGNVTLKNNTQIHPSTYHGNKEEDQATKRRQE